MTKLAWIVVALLSLSGCEANGDSRGVQHSPPKPEYRAELVAVTVEACERHFSLDPRFTNEDPVPFWAVFLNEKSSSGYNRMYGWRQYRSIPRVLIKNDEYRYLSEYVGKDVVAVVMYEGNQELRIVDFFYFGSEK